jgi:hypothetical protein
MICTVPQNSVRNADEINSSFSKHVLSTEEVTQNSSGIVCELESIYKEAVWPVSR